MTDKKIQDTIKAREAEMVAVVAKHTAMWEKGSAELKVLQEKHQTLQNQMQKEGGKNQLAITHLEGCIAELQKMLPKTVEDKKAERKKKK